MYSSGKKIRKPRLNESTPPNINKHRNKAKAFLAFVY